MDNITFKHPNITDLKDMLKKSKQQYGSKIAYHIKNKDGSQVDYTYSDVYTIIEALGTSLCNMGLRGKKIAVIGENRFEWEIAYLAIVCGVGVVVPMDKSLPENEIKSVIERSGVQAIFYSEKYRDMLTRIKFSSHNNLKHLISMDTPCHSGGVYSQKELIDYGKHLIEAGFDEYVEAKVNPYTMNVMLFTSGTTSKSKVVALSHNNICSNLLDIDSVLDVSSEDVFLSYLPLHHVFECTVGFLFPIYKGAKIVFAESTRKIVKNLHDNQVTFFACVPAIYEKIFLHVRKGLAKAGILDDIIDLKDVYKQASMEKKKEVFSFIHEMLGGNIRYFLSGAATLDIDIEKQFRYMGLNMMQAYGLTETAPMISTNRTDDYKMGSVGKPLPSVEARIADPDEKGVGELVVRGPNIMMGYYDDPESTAAVLENGWFHTGDLARIDEDGFIFICGRQKNVIVLKNGKNIFPEEMEQIINKIEGVKESLIYGKPHGNDKDDLRIYCKIVYDPEFMSRVYKAENEEQVQKALFEEVKGVNRTMPAYKAIRGIVVSKEPLIKTTTNKVKRMEEIKNLF
jgi:long-chain acyl-CoA synthetase